MASNPPPDLSTLQPLDSELPFVGARFKDDIATPTHENEIGPGNDQQTINIPPTEWSTPFWITDFSADNDGTVDRHREEFQLSELWHTQPKSVLEKMDSAWNDYRSNKFSKNKSPESAKQFRWIHLPSNNFDWAKQALHTARKSLDTNSERGVKDDAEARRFYSNGFFRDCSNSPDPKSTFHARFMKPRCERWEDKTDFSRTEVVFLMPYLHWELTCKYWEMRELINSVETQQKSIKHPPCAAAFVENLRRNHVHIRRSLDQSLYWTLPSEDTVQRDKDQVIDRYAKEYMKTDPDARAMLMVDQLWMWILDEDQNRSIIVTLFPRAWPHRHSIIAPAGEMQDKYRSASTRMLVQPKERATMPDDPLDVFDQIFEYFNYEEDKTKSYRTPAQLAWWLIDRFAANIVDEKLTADPDRKYIEYFNRYIDELMNKQKGCLEMLHEHISTDTKVGMVVSSIRTKTDSSRSLYPTSSTDANRAPANHESEYFGIAREVKILKDVGDIIEEVSMMQNIVDQQQDAIESMVHEYRHKDHVDDEKSFPFAGRSVKYSNSRPETARAVDQRLHSESGTASRVYRGNNVTGSEAPAKDGTGRNKSEPKNDLPAKGQGGTETLRTRLDRLPSELQRLSHKATDRRLLLHNLRKKARTAEKSILHLLDLKQRQENVQEARLTKEIAKAAERQGEAVMLFTIVTIIFLPLGTIAGIYGMNASEWNDGHGPKLEHLLKVLFGTSISLAIAILYLAFHRRFRNILILLVVWTWLKITHWRCFTLLMSWEDQLETAVEELLEIEGRLREPEEEQMKMRREERKQRWENKKMEYEPYLHALQMEKNRQWMERAEQRKKKRHEKDRSKQDSAATNNGAGDSNSGAAGPVESPDSSGTAVTETTGPDGRPGRDDGPGGETAEAPARPDTASNPQTNTSKPTRKSKAGSKVRGFFRLGGQRSRNPNDEESQRPKPKQSASNSRPGSARGSSGEAGPQISGSLTALESGRIPDRALQEPEHPGDDSAQPAGSAGGAADTTQGLASGEAEKPEDVVAPAKPDRGGSRWKSWRG